ncbi:MAG: RNA polymerase sigma factor RpoD/SigA [Bacteroidota bacterium]
MRSLRITQQITDRETFSLNKYLQEINREPMISIEEEIKLSQRIRQGDQIAMDKLTKANLRFVVSVAKQYQNYGLTLNDLINEGNIGLMKATKRFDETRGFKLISYAVWYIRQAIQDAINEQCLTVRLPSNKIERINRIRKEFTKMEQQLQREPTYEEIANELCILPKDVINALNISKRSVSINTHIADNDDLTLLDILEDNSSENVEQKLSRESLKIEIELAISTLPSNEANILRLCFGLNGEVPLSFEEIADQLSISSQRVRQLKESALLMLRKTSRSKPLKECLSS